MKLALRRRARRSCIAADITAPLGTNEKSRPVSRVLSLDSHSSRPCVAARLEQPTREQRGPRQCSPIWSCSEWGLPCHAALSPRAVRSYRTVSPLPDPLRAIGGLFSVALIRRLTPPRCYLALCPVEPGLSSKHLRASRLSGRLHDHCTAPASGCACARESKDWATETRRKEQKIAWSAPS